MFLFEAYCVGFIFTAFLFLQNKLIDFKLQAVSFEINLTACNAVSMICPIIAKASEPYPSIALSVFGIILILCLKPVILLKESEIKSEIRAELSMIEEDEGIDSVKEILALKPNKKETLLHDLKS